GISENRLPYDVVFILNRLFAGVGEAIERHNGAIDKYLGDGLMAIFGARDGEAAGCRQARRATSTSGSTASTARSPARSARRSRSAWGSTWGPWSWARSGMPGPRR